MRLPEPADARHGAAVLEVAEPVAAGRRPHPPPAAGVVAEAMVAITLAEVVLEKFGGDSVAETRRNVTAFTASLPTLPDAPAGGGGEGPMGDPLS